MSLFLARLNSAPPPTWAHLVHYALELSFQVPEGMTNSKGPRPRGYQVANANSRSEPPSPPASATHTVTAQTGPRWSSTRRWGTLGVNGRCWSPWPPVVHSRSMANAVPHARPSWKRSRHVTAATVLTRIPSTARNIYLEKVWKCHNDDLGTWVEARILAGTWVLCYCIPGWPS